MNKVLATLIILVFGYTGVCVYTQDVVRVDAITASVPNLLVFVAVAGIVWLLIALGSRVYLLSQLHVYTADPAKAKAIEKYLSAGLENGAYAYNTVPLKYNDVTIMPMSPLYVVHIEGPQAMVVPAFKVEKSHAILVETDALIKHVPPHLVPRMLPS